VDRISRVSADPPTGGYRLVVWCHECKSGHHDPATCTTGGLENEYGPFQTIEDVRVWVDRAAISKRAPMVFAAEDLETAQRVKPTGFSDTDWE